MSRNHEKQVNVLVAQLNEFKIKIDNSEILRKEAMELNIKLTSFHKLLYSKLYDVKQHHEHVLHFSIESQVQFEKQKEA
jgi:hypothetical protein